MYCLFPRKKQQQNNLFVYLALVKLLDVTSSSGEVFGMDDFTCLKRQTINKHLKTGVWKVKI